MRFDKNKKYLFVCAFGQSRSRQFAEKTMLRGYRAMFCGYDDEADVKINKYIMKWADEVILLDEYINRTHHWNYLLFTKKSYTLFFIDDNPVMFNKWYELLLSLKDNEKTFYRLIK